MGLHRDDLPAEVMALLREGVGIMPGHLFSASGRYRNYLRLNCAVPWSERVEHAVMTLGRLAASAEVVSR